MIYVTGDCHADFTRFNTKIFPEQYEMTKDDYVIICGDFAEYGIALKKINMRSIGWTGWKIVLLQLFFVRGTMRILTGFTAIL